MPVDQKNIVFLNRAYNDMDIQMSLVDEFARDPRFSVRVIGYPADGDIGCPALHEAAPFMRERRAVSFETVMDSPRSPLWLHLIYRAERLFASCRKQEWAKAQPLKLGLQVKHIALLKILRGYFKNKPQVWLLDMARGWKADVIVIDEVYAQPGRSYMTDSVLPALAREGVRIYIVKTGHHVYCDPLPSTDTSPAYKKSNAVRFFTPGPLDEKVHKGFFPGENFSSPGNLRMDPAWIKTLHEEILHPPFYMGRTRMKALPQGKVKISLMLSKMNYGVRAQDLRQVIAVLGAMGNVALAIKPHTRGMKFDFMPREEIGNAYIADDIPSALLTEWSDILLFTGSSVVFHGMVMGRSVGFLKFCQDLETVFDDGRSCHLFENLGALKSFVESYSGGGSPPGVVDYLRIEVFGGDPKGRVAARYKEIILEDLGMSAAQPT